MPTGANSRLRCRFSSRISRPPASIVGFTAASSTSRLSRRTFRRNRPRPPPQAKPCTTARRSSETPEQPTHSPARRYDRCRPPAPAAASPAIDPACPATERRGDGPPLGLVWKEQHRRRRLKQHQPQGPPHDQPRKPKLPPLKMTVRRCCSRSSSTFRWAGDNPNGSHTRAVVP